jgi:hypothetical protein
MVIALQTLLKLINARKNNVLLIAESSLPESQFRAFRKLLLCEFGEKGLEGELQRMYAETHQQGRDRNGRE